MLHTILHHRHLNVLGRLRFVIFGRADLYVWRTKPSMPTSVHTSAWAATIVGRMYSRLKSIISMRWCDKHALRSGYLCSAHMPVNQSAQNWRSCRRAAATVCPRPSPPPVGAEAPCAAEQMATYSSSFPRPTRSHAHRCSHLTRQHGDLQVTPVKFSHSLGQKSHSLSLTFLTQPGFRNPIWDRTNITRNVCSVSSHNING